MGEAGMQMNALLPWLTPLRDHVLAHQRGHALLLHGPAGLGHIELALNLAAAWLCESNADRVPTPCGQCTACKLIDARTHPDLLVLLPEDMALRMGWQTADDAGDTDRNGDAKASKKKPSRDIKVEAVRAATAWAASTPSRGRLKLIVLHPADAMNAVAANALLKTLEEPSASVRLLLTCTDPDLLLPTIRSRCQLLRLPQPDEPTSLQWLAGQGVAQAAIVLAAAGGRPLEARDLAAEKLDAAFWNQIAASVANGDPRLLVGLAVPRVVETLQKVCHDAMAVAAGGQPRFLPQGSLPDSLLAGARIPPLASWSRELLRVARHDDHPWNAGLLIEALVAQGRQALQVT